MKVLGAGGLPSQDTRRWQSADLIWKVSIARGLRPEQGLTRQGAHGDGIREAERFAPAPSG